MFAFLPHNHTVSRWACAYFFTIVGIAYGTVMSRVPAIKTNTGLDDGSLGLALLCVGAGGVIAFALAGWAQVRWSSRLVQNLSGFALLLCIPLLGIPRSFAGLSAAFFCLGIATGCAQVAMGTQGTLVEKAEGRPRMSGLHAMYSAGGLIGAISGAVMAGFGVGPFEHFCLLAGFFLCLYPFAASRLLDDMPQETSTKQISPEKRPAKNAGFPPAAVIIMGLLAACSYTAEGAVGDWGPVLLFDSKGASEQVAALSYAAFSTTMVIARLYGDRLRERMGDHTLIRILAVIATTGMAIAVFSPWPLLCLAGFACMGMGLSAIVPILFSAAGKRTDISPTNAVAIVTSLGFGGLLFAPPCIGLLSEYLGSLNNALFLALACCICLIIGARIIKPKGSVPE